MSAEQLKDTTAMPVVGKPTKYCSVRDSLDPNLPVTWKLELNGSYE